jgi:hypothetical protein
MLPNRSRDSRGRSPEAPREVGGGQPGAGGRRAGRDERGVGWPGGRPGPEPESAPPGAAAVAGQWGFASAGVAAAGGPRRLGHVGGGGGGGSGGGDVFGGDETVPCGGPAPGGALDGGGPARIRRGAGLPPQTPAPEAAAALLGSTSAEDPFHDDWASW